MNNLVIQKSDGSDVTTSLIVAEVFGKEHKNVLRDIESLSCTDKFRQLNFELLFIIRELPNKGHKQDPYYEITKDGFSFLVMGYTGVRAGEFKEDFIDEFNKREMMLKNEDYILMRSQQILQKRLEESEHKIKQLEDKTARQEPFVSFAKTAFATDDKIDIGMSAKILKLGYGRNTLFKFLREKGVFFANKNEPKQRFIDAGYFELKEKFIERKDHHGFVVTKVLVKQKGLAYINHLLGGNPSNGKLAKIK